METRYQKFHKFNLFFSSKRLEEIVDVWSRNFDTRKHLKKLTEQELEDIGIDKVTAIREASKPFWRK